MPENDEYINVLREQGVSRFNPIEYYRETLYQKSEKKVVKRSKKDIVSKFLKRLFIFSKL